MDQILSAPSPDDKKMWAEKLTRLHAEIEKIEREIQIFENGGHQTDTALLSPEAIRMALKQFHEHFDTLPLATRRSLVTSLLESIQVEKDELVLNLKNPGFVWQKKSPVQAVIDCESGDQIFDQTIKWGG